MNNLNHPFFNRPLNKNIRRITEEWNCYFSLIKFFEIGLQVASK